MTFNPGPTMMTNAQVRQYAEDTSQEYDCAYHSGKLQVNTLLGKLGGKVLPYSGHVNLIAVGSADQDAVDTRFWIFEKPMCSARRQRFHIVKHIAHYFLIQHGNSTSDTYITMEEERAQVEANIFASTLLMPENHFQQSISDGLDVDELALIYGVSPKAVETRMAVLNIAV